jgi:2-oxoisovalerate dehydrogenase E1 component alpha subunit
MELTKMTSSLSDQNQKMDQPINKETLCYLNKKSTLETSLPPSIDNNTLKKLYESMSLTRAMDTKAVNLQRTGQMSTYPSSCGQEAISTAVGYAMKASDVFCPYYRDQGTFLQRGVPIADIFNFWGGDERGSLFPNNPEDLPVCVPIAGQFLHATGVAFAIKHRQQSRAVVTTGGDGSTSKGDFYEAINLAGTWNLPVVFVINNNQWAISVPRSQQTGSPTIAQKAIAAGIEGIRVDGNDVIAVTHAIEQALEKARAGQGPTLIEAVCYRLCNHTTADDATRYQPEEDVKAAWQEEPIARLKNYLLTENIWNEDKENAMQADIKSTIDSAVKEYLEIKNPEKSSLFNYLYANLPNVLVDQLDELEEVS